MTIHVVQPGETISSIADQYKIAVDRLIIDNGLVNPDNLAIGQTIVIIYPAISYTVQEGDTLNDIADQYNVSVMHLLRNNPYLSNREFIYPGETIIIQYETNKLRTIETSGYAYPFIPTETLQKTLPFLTYLTVFNYRINANGELSDIDDENVINMAKSYQVAPVMMVSTFSETGVGSFDIANTILTDMSVQDKLIDNIATTAKTKGYSGVNHTLIYLTPLNKTQMEAYVSKLGARLRSEGIVLIVTISPSINISRTEVDYDIVDLTNISQSVDGILLLTYEWGYSFGPPASATPVNLVEKILQSIETIVPTSKLSMGLPVIGYDWTLPYVPGDSVANSISSDAAVLLAYEVGAAIQFNDVAKAPYYFYTKENRLHNVWFKDARSFEASAKVITDYNIQRTSIWNIMNYFAQLWFIFNNTFEIKKIL